MKIVAVAYNSQNKNCCLVKSLATYEMLKENFDLYNTSFEATNWGGWDDFRRVQEKENITIDFSESFDREGKLTGTDSDHGHTYPWTFEFDKIVKVIPGKPKMEKKRVFSDFDSFDYSKLESIGKWVNELDYTYTYDDNNFKIVKDAFNMIVFKLYDDQLSVITLTFLDKEKLDLVNETMKELEEFLELQEED